MALLDDDKKKKNKNKKSSLVLTMRDGRLSPLPSAPGAQYLQSAKETAQKERVETGLLAQRAKAAVAADKAGNPGPAAQAARRQAARTQHRNLLQQATHDGRLDLLARSAKTDSGNAALNRLHLLGKAARSGADDILGYRGISEIGLERREKRAAQGKTYSAAALTGSGGVQNLLARQGQSQAQQASSEVQELRKRVDRFEQRDVELAEAMELVKADTKDAAAGDDIASKIAAMSGRVTTGVLTPLAKSAPSVAVDMVAAALTGGGSLVLSAGALRGVAEAAGKSLAKTLSTEGYKAAAKTAAAKVARKMWTGTVSPLTYTRAATYYSSAYRGALEDGASEEDARKAAILSAIPSAIIESSGGLDNVARELVSETGKKTVAGSVLKSILRSANEEGIEELLQGGIERAAAKIYDEDSQVLDASAMFRDYGLGVAGGALFGGAARGAVSLGARAMSDTDPVRSGPGARELRGNLLAKRRQGTADATVAESASAAASSAAPAAVQTGSTSTAGDNAWRPRTAAEISGVELTPDEIGRLDPQMQTDVTDALERLASYDERRHWAEANAAIGGLGEDVYTPFAADLDTWRDDDIRQLRAARAALDSTADLAAGNVELTEADVAAMDDGTRVRAINALRVIDAHEGRIANAEQRHTAGELDDAAYTELIGRLGAERAAAVRTLAEIKSGLRSGVTAPASPAAGAADTTFGNVAGGTTGTSDALINPPGVSMAAAPGNGAAAVDGAPAAAPVRSAGGVVNRLAMMMGKRPVYDAGIDNAIAAAESEAAGGTAAEGSNPILRNAISGQTPGRPAARPGQTLREKAKEGAMAFRQAVIDVGAPIYDMAKKSGDQTLYHLYDMAVGSSERAQWSIGGDNVLGQKSGYQADLNAQKIGPSLTAIWDEVKAIGKRVNGETAEAWFDIYLWRRHEMDRLAVNPGYNIFWRDGTTAEMVAEDAKLVAELEKEYPQFREIADKVYTYNRNNLRLRVEAGLISPELEAKLNEMYPHYVPTFIQKAEDKPLLRRSGNKRVSQVLNRLSDNGNGQTLEPILTGMGRQTVSLWNNITTNQLGQRMVDDGAKASLVDGGTLDDIEDRAEVETYTYKPDAEHGQPIFTKRGSLLVYFDGKPLRVELDAAQLLAIREATGDKKMPGRGPISQEIGKINNAFKQLITGKNPAFIIRNPVRDVQDAGIYSKDRAGFAQMYADAFRHMDENSLLWQEYQAMGGVGSTYFDYRTGELTRSGESKLGLMDKIEALNMRMEQAPRFAEYLSTRGESVESKLEARYNAADITTNFKRGGYLVKYLNTTFVPFLNPSMQGFDKVVRTFSETKGAREWLKLAKWCTVLGIGPGFVSELLWGDDEEYKKLNDRDKNRNWLFKMKDGQWLRIPKGRMLSVLNGVGRAAAHAIKGEDPNLHGLGELAFEQVAPVNPAENGLWVPAMRVNLLDKNDPGETWYGSDIESQRDLQNPAWMRYDSGTSWLSKKVGKVLGLSPKKLDDLLDSYTGFVGDIIIDLTSQEAGGNLLSRNFMLDSTRNNNLSSKFYDLSDRYEQQSNDTREGSVERAAAVVTVRYLNRGSSETSDLYKQIESIQASDLKSKDKRDKVRELYQRINEVRAAYIATAEGYAAAAARVYEPGMDKDELYREANREALGAEQALKIAGDSIYKRAKEVKAAGVSYETFYDVYYDLKDIQAEEKIIEGGLTKKQITRNYLLDKTSLSDEGRQALWEQYDYAGDINAYGRAERELENNDNFKQLDDKDREYVLSRVSSYYDAPEKDRDEAASAAIVAGWSVAEYYALDARLDDFNAKDASGKSVSGLKKSRILSYLDKSGMSEGQKWCFLILSGAYKGNNSQVAAAQSYVKGLGLSDKDEKWLLKQLIK